MDLGLEVSLKSGVRTIKFNNVRRKNALSGYDYSEIARILNEDAENDEVTAIIFTGTGEYFSSGTKLMIHGDKDYEETAKEFANKFKSMVEALIYFPKLLIAVANGPSIGIGVTICSLCDIAYASDTATFQTPFVSLGLVIEGCGSYLIPRIMGKSKASELLLLGHKMSAGEALRFNLISEIIPKQDIDSFIEKLHDLGKLPLKSLMRNKKLIQDNLITQLKICADRENTKLFEATTSEEFINNVMNFLQRKNKL